MASTTTDKKKTEKCSFDVPSDVKTRMAVLPVNWSRIVRDFVMNKLPELESIHGVKRRKPRK